MDSSMRKTPSAAGRSACAPGEVCDEAELFSGGPGPRLFGEGSYSTGGSVAEGHYALPDANPHGGYGSFGDAGGLGSSELLGEEELPCTASPSPETLRAGAGASASDETAKDTRSEVPAELNLVKEQYLKHD